MVKGRPTARHRSCIIGRLRASGMPSKSSCHIHTETRSKLPSSVLAGPKCPAHASHGRTCQVNKGAVIQQVGMQSVGSQPVSRETRATPIRPSIRQRQHALHTPEQARISALRVTRQSSRMRCSQVFTRFLWPLWPRQTVRLRSIMSCPLHQEASVTAQRISSRCPQGCCIG